MGEILSTDTVVTTIIFKENHNIDEAAYIPDEVVTTIIFKEITTVNPHIYSSLVVTTIILKGNHNLCDS